MGDQLVLLQLDSLLDTTTRTHYFLWRRDGWLAHALFFCPIGKLTEKLNYAVKTSSLCLVVTGWSI
jgi:hypothetical protein